MWDSFTIIGNNKKEAYEINEIKLKLLRHKNQIKFKFDSLLITESFVFDRHWKNLNQLDGNKSQLWNICQD